jgi:hypothetical protein
MQNKGGGDMKKLIPFAIILSFTIGLFSCTPSPSPFKLVENPSMPIERPGYSILPPAGDDWRYYSDNSQGGFTINFFKRLPDHPESHTLAAGVNETRNPVAFENPQEFERWVKRTMEGLTPQDRFRILDKKIELNTKFGPYTVKYFIKSEDHGAINRGNEPFLIVVNYGFYFVHPTNPNLMIQIYYGERGRPGELTTELEQVAERFFHDIRIAK